MKHLFPIAIIAVFGLLTFGSCTKKSSTSGCTCKAKGVNNQDTTFTATKVDSGYTSLSAECTYADTVFKALYGTTYGCHM